MSVYTPPSAGPPSTRQIIAGEGLTGGGDLSTDRTLDVVATDASIIVEADGIRVGTLTDAHIPAAIARDAEVAAGYQPLDPTLTALAAQNWAANALPVGTGVDTVAQIVLPANTFPARASTGNVVAKPMSDFGLSLVDDTDAVAGRSTLGLGSAATQASSAFDVVGAAAAAQAASQPLDSDLTSIAALATTAYGRGQLTLADATADTAQLNVASASVKGLLSAASFVKLTGIWKDIVADFGADPTGAVDAKTMIQTAVDSFGSTGGVLFFPNGSYLMSGTVTISKPVILVGSGRAITNLIINHATQDQFVLATGAAGAGFEQIRLSGDTPTRRTGGFALNMVGIANAYMQQCDILFHHSGVRSAGPLQFLDDMNIREMGANASAGAAVLVESTGDRYLRRLTTDNPSDPTGFAAVRIRECSSCVISDCNLINGTNALDIVPNAGVGHAVASILAMNTFFDSSVIGVNILPASNNDTAQRIRFTNCWFGSNSTAGVRIGNGSVPNANIASIDFIGCDFFGATATPQPFGLDVQGATEWSVRGCRMSGHGTNAIKVAVGVGTADHNFAITDNLIGIALGTITNAQGITVGAGTYGRYQILDNRGFDTNTTKGLSDVGVVGATAQKNVKNNMGVLVGPLQLLASGGGTVIAGRGAVTSGTADTFLFTSRVPANGVSVGQVFRVSVALQSSSTGAFTFRIRSGAAGTLAGDTQLATGVSAAAAAANTWVFLTCYVYVVALGPTATVSGCGYGQALATAFGSTVGPEVLANVPTTADWFITLTGSTATGTYTVRSATVEVL